uniref:AP complex mu/sigma subunit domain-containing protein n=1 Tax=Nymphaea colorata TaxID=210225 RepID=A0A5K1H8Q3_9MAGN|nr:unnamed protein product [Nymphaea colorata]
MQSFVEILDKYFGNVCELDLIFNFHKVTIPISKTYFILDEILIAGYISESNKSLIYKELQIQKDLFDEKEDKNSKTK